MDDLAGEKSPEAAALTVAPRWHEISNKADTDTNDEGEDGFNIGVRDGFSEAVQAIDLLTGAMANTASARTMIPSGIALIRCS
jgi:hypothetical protein